jgi:peptidoglycan/xylan/chitin deacetylase (PgdA/CDA1 family)
MSRQSNKTSVPLGPAPVPRPDLGGTPTITGTARVGSTLTAGTANITPNGIGGLIYNWQRSNSAGNGWENPGAARTNSTYVPVAADVGRTIRVQVSSSNANGTRNSAETTAVAQAALGGTASVSGTARVGTTLTAGTGSITPSGIGGFRYQWQRTGTGSNNTYSDITGATSSTYVPVTGDVDRLIRVLVTSSNATGTITSSATSQRVQNQNQQAQYLICLTFDDGPTGSQTSGATFDVLQLLDRHGAKGSFYVNGSKINATTRPLLQRMVRDGHSVENHSWNHPNFGTLTQAQARTQIVDTTNAIVNATGVTPFSFRAPFFDWGGSNNSLLGLDVELNLAFHNAGMDTDDWEAARTATMITDGILYGTNRTYNGAQNGRANGGVVLMHDGSSTAKICQSMDVFIPQMKQWGYEFVTIRDLHERTNSGPQRFSGNGMWPRVNDWVPPQTAGSNTALWSTWPVGTRYNR